MTKAQYRLKVRALDNGFKVTAGCVELVFTPEEFAREIARWAADPRAVEQEYQTKYRPRPEAWNAAHLPGWLRVPAVVGRAASGESNLAPSPMGPGIEDVLVQRSFDALKAAQAPQADAPALPSVPDATGSEFD